MLRVLLVEDNDVYRNALKENLSERFPSMVIDEAADSEKALEKMKAASFRLLFIDIRLPGMNGLQLTQRIKKDFPNVRIAIVTGYDLPKYRQAAVQFGAEGFFVKESLEWDEVEALIKKIGDL